MLKPFSFKYSVFRLYPFLDVLIWGKMCQIFNQRSTTTDECSYYVTGFEKPNINQMILREIVETNMTFFWCLKYYGFFFLIEILDLVLEMTLMIIV